MADDIRLVINVEKKGVLSAITATENLEKKVKKLSDTYSRGGISSSEYAKGISQIAKAAKVSQVDLFALGKAIRYNSDALKAEAIAKKASADADKLYAQARRDATQEDQRRASVIKSNIAALNEQRVATQKNSSELKSFRTSTDAVYAAEQKLLRLKKLLRTEVENGNMTMRQAAAVQMQYKQSLNSMGGGLTQTKNKMSSMGVVTQQAGYQLGDFIVQVQGGQSAFIAFSQQATQMVGFLPLMAARLGLTATAAIGLSAALGIGIPLVTSLAMVLLTASKSAKDAKESATTFESALSSARSEVQGMVDDLKLLQSGFKNAFELTLTDAIGVAKSNLVEAREELERLNKAREAANFGAGLGGGGGFTSLLTGGLSDKVKDAKETVRLAIIELATAKELARQEVQRGRDASVVNQLYEARQILAEQAADAEAQAAANTAKFWADAYTQINESKIAGQELADAAYEAYKNGENLSKLDLGKGVNAAALAAGKLSKELGISLQAALNMINLAAGIEARISARAELSSETSGTGGFTPVILSRNEIQAALDKARKDQEALNKTSTKGGGGGASAKDPLQTLQEQIALQQALIGKTEAQQQLINALGVDYQSKYAPSVTDALETQITLTGILTEADTKRKEALEQAAQQQEQLADYIANSMGDALMSIVDGTMTVKDAFRAMAADIIKQLYQVLVVQRLVGNAEKGTGLAGMILGAFQADGGAWSNGSQVKAYANGGVVGSPTTFPMAGGKTGLMGEAGPEAIMPLKRGANGKLGVQMEGGGGDTIVVNQSFNFQSNGDATIKQLIAQAAPKIAQMTKSSLLDDRRRGGSTKAAFG